MGCYDYTYKLHKKRLKKKSVWIYKEKEKENIRFNFQQL